MSTTRRKFLKAGVLAALFAAVPVRNVLGQSWKDRDGNPGEVPTAQSDPLSNYSKATFRSYLNSIFELHTVYGIIAVALVDVGDLQSSPGGECFSLHFRGGSRQLRQDRYVLVHPSLGTFALLLVPTGSDRNGAQGYLATLNRISYNDMMNNPPPTRANAPGPRTNAPVTNAAPTASPAPVPISPSETAPPATTSPTITSPTTPSPQVDRKPARKRKPSWKELENEILDDLLN